MSEHLQPILVSEQRGSLHYICITGVGGAVCKTHKGPSRLMSRHACFSPKDPVMDMYTCQLAPIKPTLPVTNDCWDVFAPLCWTSERVSIWKHAAVTLKGLTFDCAFHRVTDKRDGDEQGDDFLRWSGEEWKSTKAQSHRSCFIQTMFFFVLFSFVAFFPGSTIKRRLNNRADMERTYTDKSMITFPSRKRKQTPRLLSASTSHRGRLHLFPAVPASACVTNDVRRCRCVFTVWRVSSPGWHWINPPGWGRGCSTGRCRRRRRQSQGRSRRRCPWWLKITHKNT